MLTKGNISWARIEKAIQDADKRHGPRRGGVLQADRQYIVDACRVMTGRKPLIYVNGYKEPPRRKAPPGVAVQPAKKGGLHAKK